MDKVSRINVEGRDYEVLSGGAVRGASASLADDWTKTVVLPQGAEPLDGIFLVVTFVYGNSVGTSKPQTVYSSDGETFYADEELTVPVTLPDPQNYSVTLVSGEEYSLQTYPVLNVNNTIFPVCNAKGYLCGGDKLWSPGDKVVILISDGYAQIMSAGISGSGITIYESLDAILEDLPNLSVGDVLATFSEKDIKTGVPLGTWASFANDSAPNGEWLQAGTTFNENTFPALAMMLGNNVVPEKYDHDRPSDYEPFSYTNNTDMIMDYDGTLIFSSSGNDPSVYINGVKIGQVTWTNYSNVSSIATIPVKKGDIVKITAQFVNKFVVWYKHPLFIKATPTSSDTDYEGTLNAIRNFTANAESYSTEEKWTGGYWVDGKKIYRKVIQGTVIPANGTTAIENVSRIIKQEGYLKDNNIWLIEARGEYNLTLDEQAHNVLYFFRYNAGANYDWYFTIDYTKVTED